MDIKSIKSPEFLKELSIKELEQLCKDIREYLIDNISKTGGHLASNLGVVELTVGLYYVFDMPFDKLIFDVGHQAYTHKILTGRAGKFDTLRKTNGISGFTNYDESVYDCYESGHSSNSISAMSGFILSKKSGCQVGRVISVIGDSSIANGLAFEGLNFLSTIKDENPIIILNDNKMGISKSVGAMTRMFSVMRGSKFYRGLKKVLITINPSFITNKFHQIKNAIKALVQHDNTFESMGYDYYGPYDGNDLKNVIRILKRVKKTKEPAVVHFVTKKGLGYEMAECDELGSFHGVGPFDKTTGKSLKEYKENEFSYSEIIARSLIEERRKFKFTLINPATMVGNRLLKFEREFPESIYDVGIAEEHAATMAGALALNNEKCALLMYSTFAQRAYDQILNDIARRNLHVVIGLDRAGLIAEEGSTHQGIYDVAMLNSMPNITISMGKNLAEAKALIKYAFNLKGPVVVRYPKANEIYTNDVTINDEKWPILTNGENGYIISYGPLVTRLEKLINDNKLNYTLINARFIRPLDYDLLDSIDTTKKIIVIEEVIKNGSLGQTIMGYYQDKDKVVKIKHLAINNDEYIIQASYDELLKKYKLSDEDILKEIK